MIAAASRLRKHADYQRVYAASRKQFSRQVAYFFALRASTPQAAGRPTSPRDVGDSPHAALQPPENPRVGLTVGKAMGKAVDRNRIKRRMGEAVRRNLPLLTAPVDVVLHPRRSVLSLDFAELEREIAHVFRAIEKAAGRQSPQPSHDGNITSPHAARAQANA